MFAWLTSGEAVAQSVGGKATSQPEPVAGKEVAHWSRLPIWGKEEARKYGFDLPVPVGLSGSFYTEKQDFRMPELKLGAAGGRLVNVGSLVQVTRIKTEQNAETVRADAWVLPFLNLYAIAGYVNGHADIAAQPALLTMLHAPVPKINLKLDYEGPTLGFGSTLAGGFKPIKGRPTIVFGLADLNITETLLDFKRLVTSLDPVTVVVLNLRFGVRERILHISSIGDLYVSLWGGAMYEGVQETMTGRLGILDLGFRGDVHAVNPWNAIVGGRVEIGKYFDLGIDVGCGERKSLMLSAGFRF
jgi:hypothetical protein